MKPPPRSIEIFSELRSLKIDRRALRAFIAALDAHYTPANRGTLSLAFLTHDHLAALHAEFCADPTPTDVITFPASPANDAKALEFGELCLSPQAALDYVKKRGSKVELEIRRYIAHGYLHLIGFDDLTPKDRRQMRREEAVCLSLAKDLKNIFHFKP